MLREARLVGGGEASAFPPSVVRAAQALARPGVAEHAVGAALAARRGRVGHRARGTHLARRSALVRVLAHRACRRRGEEEKAEEEKAEEEKAARGGSARFSQKKTISKKQLQLFKPNRKVSIKLH